MKFIWHYKKENHITVKITDSGTNIFRNDVENKLEITVINEMEETKL